MNDSNKQMIGLKKKAEQVFAKIDFSDIKNQNNKPLVKIGAKDHQKLTDCMKESICLFLEKFFTSLNNDEDFQMALCSQKMIRPITYNLEGAIESNKITLQLEYLNLLNFLMFRTKFSKRLGPLNIEHKLLDEEDLMQLENFGQRYSIIGNQHAEEMKPDIQKLNSSEVSYRKGSQARKSFKSKKSSSKKSKKDKKNDKEQLKVNNSISGGLSLLENLKAILCQKEFLRTLLKGLNNEHTFVMTKYVEYLNRVLFMYTKLFKGTVLTKALKQIIFAYMDVIFENATSKGPLKDQEKRKEKVISLLKGMRFFLQEVLQVTHVEIKNERNVEKALLAIFTLGIVSSKSGSRKKMIFKLEEEVCMGIIDSFPKLFNKLLQTYQTTSLICDIDIYRMPRDPSLATTIQEKINPASEKESFVGDFHPGRQSINDSFISGFHESGVMSEFYKPSRLQGEFPTSHEIYGLLNSHSISSDNLMGISKYVFKIMNPLCNHFVMKSVEALLGNWAHCNKTSLGLSGLDLMDFSINKIKKLHNNRNSKNSSLKEGLFEEDILKSDLHLKILEIILYNDICPNRMLLGVLFSCQMEEIKMARKDFQSSKFNKKVAFWTDHAQLEIDMLSFVFGYIKYCCSEQNFFEAETQKINKLRFSEFTSSFLSLLKMFNGVENISTIMWILDLISIFLQKFAYTSNLLGKTKNEWRSYISDLWTKIGKIINDDFKFDFLEKKEDPSKKKLKEKNQDILVPLRPVSPSLRAASKNVMYRLAKHFRGEEEEKDKMFDYLQYNSEQTNIIRYKYFLLITLKKSLYQMCDLFLSPSKSSSQKNISMTSSDIMMTGGDSMRLNEIPDDSSVWNIVRVRPLIDKLLNILKSRKDNTLIIQEISEILLFLSSNRSFLGDFKQDLLDIFDSDEFFKCDVKTLKMWSRIIDRVLDFSKNNAIVEYYMKNIDFKGVFVFRDTENKKRMKCFLRICFIIYSGETEKYIDKKTLKTLLEKIKNLLREENKEPRLTILILFSLRILIMRLQKTSLNELFRTIWPSIIFLLRKLIKSKNTKNEGIFLASMKLLELISCTDIEEFNLHKWAFMFEYYGVELTILEGDDPNKITEKEKGSYESTMHHIQEEGNEELVGFHVNPFLMAQMPKNTLIQFKIKDYDAISTKKQIPCKSLSRLWRSYFKFICKS